MRPASFETRVAGVLVAGREVVRPLIRVENPASRDETVGYVACGTRDDVDAALTAAELAFPLWAGLTPKERAVALLRAADVLEPLSEEFAATLTLEVGKVHAESFGDAEGAHRLLRVFAGFADEVAAADHGAPLPSSGSAQVHVRHVPKGPVAVIPPWNTPIYLAFMAVAPALMAGNPVVVKPPEIAPIAVTRALGVLAEQLPPGVVSIVNGLGPDAGAALTGHPGIRKVLFTGSTATGTTVMRSAAANITDVGMELGGNDAAIVLEDATIDEEMIAQLLAGCFGLSGQICYNVKRIYVHASRLDEFVGRFSEGLERIVVGDPRDPLTVIGPLATPEARERARELLEDARSRGARILEGGRMLAPETWEHGNFVRPALAVGGDPHAALVMEEQFAPIIPVIPFATVEEAVTEANATHYGLAGSVWSADEARAWEVARRLEAGTVFVNIHRVGASPAEAPFGGFKRSGIGRNHGVDSIFACMEQQSVVRFEDAGVVPGLDRWRAG